MSEEYEEVSVAGADGMSSRNEVIELPRGQIRWALKTMIRALDHPWVESMIQSDVYILKDFARVGNIKETCFQVTWKCSKNCEGSIRMVAILEILPSGTPWVRDMI